MDIPGAVAGIPVDPRLHLSVGRFRYRFLERTLPHAFVFAYRLQEVRYSARSNSISKRIYTNGAQLHDIYGAKITCDPDNIQIENEDSNGNACSDEEEIEFEGLSPVDVSEVSRDDSSEEWDIDDPVVVDGCVIVDTPQHVHLQGWDMPQDSDSEEEVLFPEC